MEVISAVASFIAIGQALAATSKIIDALQSLFGAKHEIVQLLNDVDVLRSFGDILRDTIQHLPEADAEARFSVPKTTYPLVKRIEEDMILIVSKLEDLCRACQEEGTNKDQTKVSRVKWLLYKRKITSLTERVKRNREYLQLVLSCTSLFASTSNGMMLLDIHTVVTTHAQQTLFAPPPLQSIEQEHRDNESINRVITDDDSSESIASSIDAIASQGNCSQLTSSKGSREGSLYMNYSEETIQTSESSVHITASLRRHCLKDCGCQCHSSTSRIRPQPGNSVIFGWLKSAYNSAPRLGGQSCDILTCQRHRSPTHLNFRIPLLFCSRALEATLSFSSIPGAGASLHLRVPRAVLADEMLYFHLAYESIEGIYRELFHNNYSPLDECEGQNILLELMDKKLYEVIPMLLNGARSIVQNSQCGKEAATLARYRMKRTNVDDEQRAILRELITLDDESTNDFWPIHEAAQNGGDLMAALQESPEDMNLLNDFGFAPLHLAIRYGNSEGVTGLISYGADLNCFDIFGCTPLINAVLVGNCSHMQLLIDCGCSIDYYSKQYHQTALWYAIRSGSAEACRLLLRNGASTIIDGRNALHLLACSTEAIDVKEKFQLFVDAGVNIEEKNEYGSTVLRVALNCRNAYMLRLLIDAGYRLDASPNAENSLVIAAWYGCAEIIDVIDQAGFTADVRVQDRYGRTPLEILKCRMDADPLQNAIFILSAEDIEAFYKLLQGVRDRYLTAEIQILKKVITHIEAKEISITREVLGSVIQEKIAWNIPAERRTFRAIDVQIREGMMEAAIESLEEFIEVSEERIGSHPKDNDYFYEPEDETLGVLI
ncbi:ankyrin [Daldinia eschscholtzii]|nr:ankyrin [Daldinia eschscholtzii]